jgi:hypothetical protein
MPVSRTTLVRSIGALGVAAVITFLGIWAFLASIHDHSQWLISAQALALPIAALARTVDFLHSNFVYWASIVASALFWWSVVYVVMVVAGHRRGILPVA